MLIALSLSVLILTLIAMPFVFSFDLKADVFSNNGSVVLSLFSVPIFKASLKIESESATEKNIVITSGKKRDEIHLNTDKNDKKSIIALFKAAPIMSYIIMESLDVEAEIGFVGNAFATTMTVGFLRTFFAAVAAFLRSRQNIEIADEITPSYNRNEIDLKVFGIFKLSIANIINGIIAGRLNKLQIKAKQNGKLETRALKIKI